MTRHCIRALVFLASVAFAFAADDAPKADYHADVEEVRLTFFATDQDHHPVAAVKEKDFVVVDQDLVVRNFNSFRRAVWTDLDVAVILDSSESAATQFKQEVAGALRLMTRSPEIPERSFSLISFRASTPALICSGNCRAATAASPVVMQAGALTPLFDSVVLATAVISQRANPHSKKALVLFSDGEDTISRNGAADALAAALANDIPIYAVDLNRGGHSPAGTALLQKLAGTTGGRYFVLEHDPSQALDAVLADFHAAYTVTYRVPDRTAGFHSVRILPTHNLNLHFHCRSGYDYSASRN